MVDLGFLLFYTFLVSFSFHSFLFKNLQDRTLNGKIVDYFFSHPIFLLFFLFKNLQFQLWMVRSWIPTSFMPKVCFQTAARINFGCVDVEERAGPTTNTCLNSKHPLDKKNNSFMVLLEDILSILLRNCPGTALGENELLDGRHLDLLSMLFSSPFPFTAFYSKTCKTEL